MVFNPSAQKPGLNNPTERANELNDPQFSEQQGYFPYDLTHQEFISPLFGLVTPSMHVHTVPADRIVQHDDIKTVLSQIQGNLLSTVNQYVDTIFVPMRAYFPTNYEKLIPNPTKGQDLPNMALPQFPISYFITDMLSSAKTVSFPGDISVSISDVMNLSIPNNDTIFNYAVSRYLYLATMLSRGQLLDYLGCAFDDFVISNTSPLQTAIDTFYNKLFNAFLNSTYYRTIYCYEPDLLSNTFSNVTSARSYEDVGELSKFRDAVFSCLEDGLIPIFGIYSGSEAYDDLVAAINDLRFILQTLFTTNYNEADFARLVNTSDNPFNVGFINIEKPIAYQMSIAQYFTRDAVDNVFNSDLYMQVLRSIMFPADSDGYSKEPTFLYNGVSTEYDYISCGATFDSLIKDTPGSVHRQLAFISTLFFLRRSLRYGDYLVTARPNLLAVGQLNIPVSGGNVSVIDVTKNLLVQRYLNAANYIGSGMLPYYASIFGVTPTDTGCNPRFVAHRKIVLKNDLVVNTAENQGNITTNMLGYSDNNAFDVFIDDFGVILSMTSYDVLPVYKSGIENTYHFADRFDYFNPMLQNIGDQAIRQSELIGKPSLRNKTFGYTMRNAEYKYKMSKAHGAFVNSLPYFLLSYPVDVYTGSNGDVNISPDFIRDKPVYFDQIITQQTGVSPGEYFHFVVSVTNELRCSRKIQATPPVLF